MKYFIKQNKYVLITLGAIPGAIFRWQIKEILIANLIGCFLIGFINASSLSKRYKLLLGFGLCGSLTTFSGWSFHLYELIHDGLYAQFFLNSILDVLIGFSLVALGHLFAKKIITLG